MIVTIKLLGWVSVISDSLLADSAGQTSDGRRSTYVMVAADAVEHLQSRDSSDHVGKFNPLRTFKFVF